NFLYVMSNDGVYGYVQRKFLGESEYKTSESEYKEVEGKFFELGEKVRLGWHQVTREEDNAKLSALVSGAEGLNVISPTWYRVSDTDGNIISKLDDDYIEEAHKMGLSVWALVDNFATGVPISEVLASTEARENLINNLVSEALQHGFDGINVDFESIPQTSGEDFVEFIKELSVETRKYGIILSVDNNVPYNYNSYYGVEEQGLYVDYIIIMAYDEHWAGSTEAGSVASIGFVNDAISLTLSKVEAKRAVIGIPFYTRVWREAEDGTLSSIVLTMAKTEDYLKTIEAKKNWDEETGQYYVEYIQGGNCCKIWIEDIKSIEEKLRAVGSAGCEGIAAWRLGMETDDVWPLVSYLIQ
ncbi:MAG: hypothetical protein K6B75_05015, partial [Lachnospiraceae bacterium]|nr:hypothetical protein [Lachnospiraceae bacterium]